MFSELPPLAREIPKVFREVDNVLGITPACARNTARPRRQMPDRRNYPRLRGEYNFTSSAPLSPSELPPLARGIRYKKPVHGVGDGITPACAGNTLKQSAPTAPTRNYPRLRGEYPSFTVLSPSLPELPPLARGIPSDSRALHLEHGITPAYAGNTPGALRGRGRLWNYPRSLGEYLVCIEV